MANLNHKPAWGYLYIAWLGVVCSVMLIVNFNLVSMAVSAFPSLAADVRANQMVQFFVPIVMIFVEFWIYDFLIDRADRSNDRPAGPADRG